MTQNGILSLEGLVLSSFIPHGRHHVESDIFYVQLEDMSYVERTQPNGLIVLYANHKKEERIVGFGIPNWSRLPKDELHAHPQ